MTKEEIKEWANSPKRFEDFYKAYVYLIENATGPGEIMSCNAEISAIYLLREYFCEDDWVKEDICAKYFYEDIASYRTHRDKRDGKYPEFLNVFLEAEKYFII